MPTKIDRTTTRKRAGAPATKSKAPVPQGEQIHGRKPGASDRFSGVIFGPPKTGKTTLVCSGKNTLLMQFDPAGDTTETLRGRGDITVVEPGNYSEIQKLIRALHTTDRGRFPFVAVDSVTFLTQMIGGKELTETYIAGKDVRRPYGKIGAAVSQIVADLVRIPETNVLFTAHLQREIADEDDLVSVPQDASLGEHEVRVAVTPMIWKTLGPAVSFIGRTYKDSIRDTKGNVTTTYRVSFNDGDRSPAGARITMPGGDLEITPDLLQQLAVDLRKEA